MASKLNYARKIFHMQKKPKSDLQYNEIAYDAKTITSLLKITGMKFLMTLSSGGKCNGRTCHSVIHGESGQNSFC